MPRGAAGRSIEEILQAAAEGVVARATRAVESAVAAVVAASRKGGRGARPGPAAGRRARRRGRPADVTRWVADSRARRVPLFVIEMTGGLDTKKRIVERFGAGVVFEKGKPLPAAQPDGAKGPVAPARAKARPPTRRRAAAAGR
jgi:hypothetical protein